jgi:type VI secretion system secreted protein VgrG
MTRGIDLDFESGEDSLSVRHFSVSERMSGSFELVVVALSKHTDVDLEALVGKGAGLAVRGVVPRFWTGVVSHAGQVQPEESHTGLSTYLIHILPSLWLMSHRRGHRMFQHLSIPDIAEKLLGEWKVDHQMKIDKGKYPKLEYCLQYGESDYVFFNRILERAGICYYYVEKPGKKAESVLVLADAPQSNESRGSIRYVDNPNEAARKEFVTDVILAHDVAPGMYTLRDYNFRQPDYKLFGEVKPAPLPEGPYEQYYYLPGGALVEVDSAPDKTPVADDQSKARHDEKYAKERAQISQDAQRVRKRYVQFKTNVLDLYPGVVFSIEQHAHKELAGKKLLVVNSRAEGDVTGEWSMFTEAVFADVPYRPPQVTSPPRLPGVQSAIVVGPSGQEIYTDEFGRVRVRFHWDREAQFNDHASCWIRVSQTWAGGGFGGMQVPRIGHEVLVDFLDGDPDQPIIVGRLYNGASLPPYVLPKGKTQSTWKTDTSPHVDNSFNEIMFEDKAGKELVFVQAQKDMRKLVKRHDTERIYHDRLNVVGGSRVAVVAKTDEIQVGEQRLVKIVKENDLKILKMEDPDVTPQKTFYEVKDKKITLTTGSATILLDGPDITIEADGGMRFTAEGQILIEGGPNVYLNEKPGKVPAPRADKTAKDAVPKPTGRVLVSILKLFATKKATEAMARKDFSMSVSEPKEALRRRVMEEAKKICKDRDDKTKKAVDAALAGDKPVVVDRLILGAGNAAVADYNTLPNKGGYQANGVPNVLAVAGSSDPWPDRKEVMGQTAAQLSYNNGLSSQPVEYVDNPNDYCPSDAYGAAVADTRAKSGMSVYKAYVESIKETPDGSPAKYKVDIATAPGQTKSIYTNNIDIATGPGPARKLADGVLPSDDEKKLKAAGTLVYGDQHLATTPLPAGSKVLVYGGGASAAWNVNHSGKNGADVNWSARGAGGKDPFAGANLARNRKVMEETAGSRQTREITKVTPVMVDGKQKALVQFNDGKPPQVYDQVVVSIGQDSKAKGGVENLMSGVLEKKPGDGPKMTTIEGVKPDGKRDGNLVGLYSGDQKGGIRVVGAAATATGLGNSMSPQDQQRYNMRLNQRANGMIPGQSISKNTEGVPPGIEVWAPTYGTLNRGPTAAQVTAGDGSKSMVNPTPKG